MKSTHRTSWGERQTWLARNSKTIFNWQSQHNDVLKQSVDFADLLNLLDRLQDSIDKRNNSRFKPLIAQFELTFKLIETVIRKQAKKDDKEYRLSRASSRFPYASNRGKKRCLEQSEPPVRPS